MMDFILNNDGFHSTPGLLTFSTFINAHVASGEMIGAEQVSLV